MTATVIISSNTTAKMSTISLQASMNTGTSNSIKSKHTLKGRPGSWISPVLELKNNPSKLVPVASSPIFSNKAKSLKRSVLALVKSRRISSSSHSKDFQSPNKSRNSSSGAKSPAQIKTTSLHNPQHKQANNLISPQMSNRKAQASTKSLFG